MKRFALLFAAFLTLGCGGGSGSGEPIPLGEVGAKFATVSCAKIFECCTAADIAEVYGFFGGGFTDEADCVAKLGPLMIQQFQIDTQASLDAGKLTDSADDAGASLA